MQTLTLIFLGVLSLLLGGILYLLWRQMSRSESSQSDLMLQQQMDSLRTQVADGLHKNSEMLQKQLEAVGQNLRHSSGDINQRLDSAAKLYADLRNQLGQLTQANQQIQVLMKDVSSLQDILRPPKLRGGMGEVLLENLLGEILPSEHFTAQYRFSDGQIVDAVIRMREGLISVDAKFPLENFKRMLDSMDDPTRRAARRDFARNVRKHIDDIHDKYIRTDEGTLPFALMYIPAENVYYETIIKTEEEEGEKALYAYATSRQIIPVSPNSFYAYLMTLAQGFRGIKVEEKAREIIDNLNRLSLELGKFTEDFRKVGVHLTNAQSKFGDAEKRLNRFEDRLLSAGAGDSEHVQPDLIKAP